MITRNLRFPDLETWETLAKDLNLYVNYPTYTQSDDDDDEDFEPELIDNWQWVIQSRTHAIDNIGTIWNDDGEYEFNEETGEVTVIKERTPMAGYHVNYKCNVLPASLTSYEVHPEKPYRKFAGDP